MERPHGSRVRRDDPSRKTILHDEEENTARALCEIECAEAGPPINRAGLLTDSSAHRERAKQKDASFPAESRNSQNIFRKNGSWHSLRFRGLM
jgi:hypothetical protein